MAETPQQTSFVSIEAYGKLIGAYHAASYRTHMSTLLESVSQDPEDETVDFAKSANPVRAAAHRIGGALDEVRHDLISWLSSIWFHAVVHHDEISSSHPEKNPYFLFLFETRVHIQRGLVVAMILEGDASRAGGVAPKKKDIPQCLLFLMEHITRCRERVFPQLAANHTKMVDGLKDDYVDLYLIK